MGKTRRKALIHFMLALTVSILALGPMAAPVLASSHILIPETNPGSTGGVDVGRSLNTLFNSIVGWILLGSGGVIVIVLAIIGLRLIWTRDARQRAEVMDWLLYVVVGAGLIFGGTLITKMLVDLFARTTA